MRPTKSSSSSLPPEKSLVSVLIDRLHLHPANPNVMTAVFLEKLARNIERQGRYPPLIVRPHPDRPDEFQILDGAQRFEALRRLGCQQAVCFIWPCNDADALVLMATLNRLHGEDVPRKRAELIEDLRRLLPTEALHELLPEDGDQLDDLMKLLDLDSAALLADLTAAVARNEASGPRLISFVVLREDEPAIETAIEAAGSDLVGTNRRGRALAAICRQYSGERHA